MSQIGSFVNIPTQFEITYNNRLQYFPFDSSITYEDFVNLIQSHFTIKITQQQILSILYIDRDNDNEQIDISSEADFQEVLKFHFRKYKTNIPIDVSIVMKTISSHSSSKFSDNLMNTYESKIQSVPQSEFNSFFIKNNIIDNYSNQSPNEISKIELQTKEVNSNTKVNDNTILMLLANSELCNLCKQIIHRVKYVCSICDSFTICSKCFEVHLHCHPMLAISIINSFSMLNSKNDYLYYLRRNKVLDSIHKKKKSETFRITIQPFEQMKKIAIPKKRIYTYQLIIESKEKNIIHDTIYIVFKNSNSLQIKCENIKELLPKKLKMVDAYLFDENTNLCELEISLYSNDNKIECNTIKTTIQIVEENQVDIFNAIFYFEQYKHLSELKDTDKVTLYNAIRNSSITIPIKDLDKIAKDNQNDFYAILNECSKEIERKADMEGLSI